MRKILILIMSVSFLTASSDLQATIADMKEALYKLIEERKTLKNELSVNSITNSDRDKKIEKLENEMSSLVVKIESLQKKEGDSPIIGDERHIKTIREYIAKKRGGE